MHERESNYTASGYDSTTIFWKFSYSYNHVHGWLSLIICILSFISNFLNMKILTSSNLVNENLNKYKNIKFNLKLT